MDRCLAFQVESGCRMRAEMRAPRIHASTQPFGFAAGMGVERVWFLERRGDEVFCLPSGSERNAASCRAGTCGLWWGEGCGVLEILHGDKIAWWTNGLERWLREMCTGAQ